jgi:hypothetical protein
MWRVGSGGLRILYEDGSEVRLPAGRVLTSLPDRYTGTLHLIAWPREAGRYDDKACLYGDLEAKG